LDEDYEFIDNAIKELTGDDKMPDKEEIKEKIEEIAEHAADGSVSVPIDIDKNGKTDVIVVKDECCTDGVR
jgi:tRNA(Ser,Leu) C12 N-acetylase TAN1